MRIEELQELWKSQPEPAPPAVAAESRGMAAALRRFRRRQYVINGIKLALIAGMSWFLPARMGDSTPTLLGLALFLAGMIGALIADWRIQSAIARLDFTRPSVGFVDAALEQLLDPNARFRRSGWLAIALVTVGMNLVMEGRPAAQSVRARIIFHACATLFPFAVFAFGLRLRAKRYAMDYRPLVERLAAMKAALEEHVR